MQGAIGASYFKLRPCQKLPIVHESFGPFPLSTAEFGPELSFFQFRRILVGILGLYWDNGKENGANHLGFRVHSSP